MLKTIVGEREEWRVGCMLPAKEIGRMVGDLNEAEKGDEVRESEGRFKGAQAGDFRRRFFCIYQA